MSEFQPILTEHINKKDCQTLSFYQNEGGYTALKQVLDMDPSDVIDIVKSSNLRGRGGAGFSAGVKWGFIPKDTKTPTYLINPLGLPHRLHLFRTRTSNLGPLFQASIFDFLGKILYSLYL